MGFQNFLASKESLDQIILRWIKYASSSPGFAERLSNIMTCISKVSESLVECSSHHKYEFQKVF